MTAVIYQPAKTAMQSGRARTRQWRLEVSAERARNIDPLMGWTGIDGTANQVQMVFETREQAERFAKQHDIDYTVREPKARQMKIKAYADNFAHNRVI